MYKALWLRIMSGWWLYRVNACGYATEKLRFFYTIAWSTRRRRKRDEKMIEVDDSGLLLLSSGRYDCFIRPWKTLAALLHYVGTTQWRPPPSWMEMDLNWGCCWLHGHWTTTRTTQFDEVAVTLLCTNYKLRNDKKNLVVALYGNAHIKICCDCILKFKHLTSLFKTSTTQKACRIIQPH